MMVRDGCGAQKSSWMAHMKDKNSLINHAKVAPQLIHAPWCDMG
jgi:hypothetical protein